LQLGGEPTKTEEANSDTCRNCGWTYTRRGKNGEVDQ